MLIRIFYYYYKNIILKKYLNSSKKLNHHHKKQFNKLVKKTLKKSSYYKNYINKPFHEWPIIDKKIMMEFFDEINTVKIKKKEALTFALKAEKTRNFSSLLKGVSIGLSSGTSGVRGLFLTSSRERDAWVGCILAKILPEGISAKEKIAFFLRANNPLYTNLAKSRRIQFYFFDLFSNFNEHIEKLNSIQSPILVAPPSVLLLIAQHKNKLTTHPKKIIAVAEILEKKDEKFISQTFNQPVAQIYQCTEGFLAYSDKKTNELIMNEEFLIIEKEWVDETRFIPIITDLFRTSQPIIRYRLDDILVSNKTEGVFTKLASIEGRFGDVLYGKKNFELIPIFADTLRQHMLTSPVDFNDYRIVQLSLNEFTIRVSPNLENKKLLISHLNQIFIEKDCEIPNWQWQVYEKHLLGTKMRRIESRLAYKAIKK